ncbi:MAG: hypothetical protein LBH70_02030 [Spirochaetaceae bacterium]|jgi:protein involved in polysaccharide export with SLBB domain|nr:hypothetical protein [Spirochaetaceae bacterium]
MVSVVSAQENPPADTIAPNSQLALSNPDYLVTSGDVYTLTYTANGAPVAYRIIVDSSYTVRISNLGMINAAGKTFRQLRRDVETFVVNNHPFSGVQLILTQPGIFRVLVAGEVTASVEISTWAMERLSSLTRFTTPFASLRNISIKSSDGQVRTYDLFKAKRDGDMSQDPYLRPDDVITFDRLERRVTIRGAVERPGAYQLLPDENLTDLIDYYARGFTPMADKSRMELIRYEGTTSSVGERISLKELHITENFTLRNYDIITIPDISEWWPPITSEESAVQQSVH